MIARVLLWYCGWFLRHYYAILSKVFCFENVVYLYMWLLECFV